MNIHYVIGDATQPEADGQKIIVYVCNDIGGWGRGFVLALSRRWSEPEARYHRWHRGEEVIPFALGEVQFAEVGDDLRVANLIGQHRKRPINGVSPIRPDAIHQRLQRVAAEAMRLGASVHMPRIGCGLVGGKWEDVEKIVEQELASKGVPVTV